VSEGAIAVLRQHPMLRIFVIGQGISLVGMWMQAMAQSWIVVTLTSSTSAIATVSFVASLPILALSMPGGVIADRLDRRRILIVTQLLLAAQAFLLAWLLSSGRLDLTLLYLVAAGTGAIMAFDVPAMQAFVPSLVPPAHIPVAVALTQMLHHGTRFVGPALAGALIAATSPSMALVANGLSFFAVIFSLMAIRPPPRPIVAGAPRAGGLGEALRHVGSDAVTRALLGYTALTTTLLFPFFVVFSALFVKDLLGGREAEFGWFMSVNGAGALAGALLLLRIPPAWRGRSILGAATIAATALATQSYTTSFSVALPLQVAITFGVSLGLGLSATIVQVLVPPHMRGRVMALNGMAFTGLMPSAALLLGAVADAVGLRATMRLCAALFAAIVAPWLLSAGLGRKVAHQPPPAAQAQPA
jgi:MFS family permease